MHVLMYLQRKSYGRVFSNADHVTACVRELVSTASILSATVEVGPTCNFEQ